MARNSLFLILFICINAFASLSDDPRNIQNPDGSYGILQSDGSGNLNVYDDKNFILSTGIRLDLNSQFDETQSKQDELLLETQGFRSDNNFEFDQTQTLLTSEFNETQVNQDEQLSETQGFRSDYNLQTDETQLLLTNEFDETQINQDELLLETQNFRLDNNSEFDETQLLLSNEFNETQINQDEQLAETQGFRSDYNLQTDETQSLMVTIYNDTISFIQSLYDSITRNLNEVIPVDSIALFTRSVLAGFTEAGSVQNVALSNNRAVKVAINDRPSELRGRTRVLLPISRNSLTGTPTIYYTVTPGNTLYISSFLVTALNSSSADGQFQLRDNTTVYVDFLVPSRVSGSSPSSFSVTAPTLPEPLPFATNLNFIEITGNVEIAGYLIGYLEPN